MDEESDDISMEKELLSRAIFPHKYLLILFVCSFFLHNTYIYKFMEEHINIDTKLLKGNIFVVIHSILLSIFFYLIVRHIHRIIPSEYL